jgi:hypothetical protein
MKWYWKLCILLTALLPFLGSGCAGPLKATYYRFTPMVIEDDAMADVILEGKVEGSPTAVKLRLESTGSEVLLRDDGSGGDAVSGDDIFTVTLGAADVLHNFTPDDVNRNFIGYLRIYVGSEQEMQYNVFADIITDDIPPVEIKIVASDVQYTEHLVNIVDPGFFSGFTVSLVIQKFYSHFDDNYDFINVIYEIPHIGNNRYHFGIRNDVNGIGLSLFDNSATYGSGGRLLGCTIFPIPTFFDGASPDYQHELGHQWINFLSSVPPLDYVTPHWPLSDLASGIMGWATVEDPEGLTFNFDLTPVGSDFQLVANYDPKVFTDLSLYLMGFIPPGEVSEHFVFDDQDQTPEAGGTLLGPVTYVGVDDVISQVGPRVPSHEQAQKKFRVATIIVSKDGLLSENAMRLYDYFSARAEETQVIPYSSGFEKAQTNPFYLATRELGRLDTRIKRYILVDASRDGGVWWFPQAGPFDPLVEHQGKALAEYLRLLGHKVLELPRSYTITAELLADYDIVIRAVGLGEYAPTEIDAYLDYVQKGGNLLLLADHGPPDGLAISFGLTFEAATRGENLLNNYVAHPITTGVGPLFYNCGGGLTSSGTAQILGRLSNLSYLDLNNNGVKDPNDPSGPPVLGVMSYGSGRVVFCGDTNLWEAVPQPLTDNVLRWFADP